MAVVFWPYADLPTLLLEGYNFSFAENRMRTPTDMGPGKVRLQNVSAPHAVKAAIRCSTEKLARFQTFWLIDVDRGSKPFYIKDVRFDNTVLATNTALLTTLGDVLISGTWWMLVRFPVGNVPSTPVLGDGIYTVTFDLEVL